MFDLKTHFNSCFISYFKKACFIICKIDINIDGLLVVYNYFGTLKPISRDGSSIAQLLILVSILLKTPL